MNAPAILGTGYCVPRQVRSNDAPIFDWLRDNQKFGQKAFTGYVERRVLAEGEDLMTVMVPAARDAIADAGLQPADIDLVLGIASVSPYDNPNALSQLHAQLGLPQRAWVLPLGNDFTNLNAALWLADSLVRAGRVRHVLIALGGNWTRYVDYHTPQAIGAGDGAGAVVLGPVQAGRPGWQVVDQETITQSQYYGSMFMQGDPVQLPGQPPLWTRPSFHITPEGMSGFWQFGQQTVPLAATALLQRNGVAPADVVLLTHQASSALMDHWRTVIAPGRYLSTLECYANMTVATIAVTLAWGQRLGLLDQPWLLLLGVGGDMHANALLLKRV